MMVGRGEGVGAVVVIAGLGWGVEVGEGEMGGVVGVGGIGVLVDTGEIRGTILMLGSIGWNSRMGVGVAVGGRITSRITSLMGSSAKCFICLIVSH